MAECSARDTMPLQQPPETPVSTCTEPMARNVLEDLLVFASCSRFIPERIVPCPRYTRTKSVDWFWPYLVRRVKCDSCLFASFNLVFLLVMLPVPVLFPGDVKIALPPNRELRAVMPGWAGIFRFFLAPFSRNSALVPALSPGGKFRIKFPYFAFLTQFL